MSTRTSVQAPHAEFFPAPPSRGIAARWVGVVLDDVVQLRRFWPVVQNMVAQDLRVRYQRSMLGFFWTLINPILMMTTLTFVFSQLMNENYKEYAKYLFAGMVPWGFLSASLSDCAFCIIQNEGLIRKIFLPKLVFPITRVLISLTTLILTMVALFVLLVPMGLRFLVADADAAGGDRAIRRLHAGARPPGGDDEHVLSRHRPPRLGLPPGVVLRDADPLSTEQRLGRPAMVPCSTRRCRSSGFSRRSSATNSGPARTTILAAAGLAALSLGVGYAAFKSFEAKFIFRL